jgi:16S rRNA (guanine966-N2)-methyltransferase
MSVKILGGRCKGFPLATPRTESTRPTSVLIRRKLYDWRQNLEGMVFIDLFAGSGAMGFEALSRGAEEVFLNDDHRLAFQILKENAKKLADSFKLDPSKITITGLEAMKWLSKELSHDSEQLNKAIIYLDPPYENHQLYFKVMEELRGRFFPGEIWLEADRLKGPKKDELTKAFESVNKTVEQGDHFVLVGKVI